VVDPDSNLIMVRRWRPESWEMSETREIYVRRYLTLHEFGVQVAQLLDIPIEFI